MRTDLYCFVWPNSYVAMAIIRATEIANITYSGDPTENRTPI